MYSVQNIQYMNSGWVRAIQGIYYLNKSWLKTTTTTKRYDINMCPSWEQNIQINGVFVCKYYNSLN